MSLIIKTLFIGILTVTSYRSVPNQTDSSPYITSNGERVHKYGCAISRDLHKRWGGPLDYGDFIYVDGYGLRVVNDLMAARHKNAIDLWVGTFEEEKAVGVKHLNVWIIQSSLKGVANEKIRRRKKSILGLGSRP